MAAARGGVKRESEVRGVGEGEGGSRKSNNMYIILFTSVTSSYPCSFFYITLIIQVPSFLYVI